MFSTQGMHCSTPSAAASMKYTMREEMDRMKTIVTRIFPIPVCAEINSPAQSFASDMKSLSSFSSGFCPWSRIFFASSFAFSLSSSLSLSSGFVQKNRCMILMMRTDRRPRRKVKTEERRKHHHFRSFRHSSSSMRGIPSGANVS